MPGGHRRWSFTWNHPGEGVCFANPEDKETVRYAVWQREMGEQGTEHFQGYVVFKDSVSMGICKRRIGGDAVHVAISMGNHKQNKDYCTKPATRVQGPWEIGICPDEGAGKRNDLKQLCEEVQSGKTDFDIATEHPEAYARYATHVSRLRAAFNQPERRDNITIITIVGPTGIGKTHWAFEHFPDLYRLRMPDHMGAKVWWDGYLNQRTILLDEVTGQLQLADMLMILDKYPLSLDIKCSAGQAHWTTVIITTNLDPADWYPANFYKAESLAALNRRLTTPPSAIYNCQYREEIQQIPLPGIGSPDQPDPASQ